MKIAIIYYSKTGITRQAAKNMAAVFESQDHICSCASIDDVNMEDVITADMICLGCWTAGMYVMFQHPGKPYKQFVAKLPDLKGKKIVLFTTYKLAIGPMFKKMAKLLDNKHANIIGEFKFRSSQPDEKFAAFASSEYR